MTSAVDEYDYWTAQARIDAHRAAAGAFAVGTPEYDANQHDHVEWIVPRIAQALGGQGAVLEVGCGPGRLLLPLARRFPDVTFFGCDVSQEMMFPGVRAAAEAGTENAHFWHCDGRHLPDTGTSYDAVYSVLCFQHLDTRTVRNYLRQAVHALRPHGLLLFQYVPVDADRADGAFMHHHQLDALVYTVEGQMTLVDVEADPDVPEWEWVQMRRIDDQPPEAP